MNMKKEEQFIYGKYFGGWASHQQHHESHAYKIPEGLDLKNVAPLMCAGVTVLKPMAKYFKKGEKIAIVGVGGLGHLAVQYAVKLGLHVDAFESGVKENKESLVKKLGATNIYKWTDKKVLASLKGQYDGLLHTVSEGVDSDLMDALLATMKKGGKILLIGLPPNAQKFKMTYHPMFINQWSIIGSCCGGRKATEFMLQFTRDNGVECMSEHYSWEDFPKALDKLENGTPKFRGIVDMDKFTKDFGKNIKH
jgi:D-arabinose 1-dehydrogenase-like Zn-dependent alcohol dehydrogenase